MTKKPQSEAPKSQNFFTNNEIAVINKAIQLDGNSNLKTYENLLDLKKAMDILGKLMANSEYAKNEKWEIIKESWEEIKIFIDWEIEFTTEEKFFIKQQIETNKRSASDWAIVFAILEKIK